MQSDQGLDTLPTLALIDSNGDSDSDNEIMEWSDADADNTNYKLFWRFSVHAECFKRVVSMAE